MSVPSPLERYYLYHTSNRCVFVYYISYNKPTANLDLVAPPTFQYSVCEVEEHTVAYTDRVWEISVQLHRVLQLEDKVCEHLSSTYRPSKVDNP